MDSFEGAGSAAKRSGGGSNILPRQAAETPIFKTVAIDRVHNQECSTPCKIQGQAVKEVTLNRSADTHAAIQLPAA